MSSGAYRKHVVFHKLDLPKLVPWAGRAGLQYAGAIFEKKVEGGSLLKGKEWKCAVKKSRRIRTTSA